jgi:hypothetical protein
VRLGGLGKLKKFIHLIGSRTHNLLACSAVPSITLGNYQCSGAAPIFINNGVIIAYENIFSVMIIWFVKNFIITKNSREVEAKA